MRLKSYILIVLLAVLGVLSQHKNEAPNQEIVLQFHDVAIPAEAAQSTIAKIKAQLERLGVTNIRIKEQENGILRICYHSDKALADVKKTFSRDTSLEVAISEPSESHDPQESPSKNQRLSYKLDIFEIQKQDLQHLDLNGVTVPVLKLKTDHYFEPNKFLICYFDATCELLTTHNNALNPEEYISQLKRHLPQRIPQVRAGPSC